MPVWVADMHGHATDLFVFASLRYARLAGTKRGPVIDALIAYSGTYDTAVGSTVGTEYNQMCGMH